MSLEKAKQLLGEKYKDMSDEEIQNIIDMLKSICSIVVEDYLKNRD